MNSLTHSSRTILDKRNGGGSKIPQFSSWHSLIVLTSHVTSHPRSESIWTNSFFKVAFCIARTINFVCFIFFPDCRLWIENSASFPNFSSAWIPEDINAAITACFVFAINPFIVTHTHWQWVSALVAVIWYHLFCFLHLKDASVHGMKWLFTNSSLSFCFPLKSSTLRHVTLLFRYSQEYDLKSRDSPSICSWGCVAAPASCWASISPLALISFTRLRNKANALPVRWSQGWRG